jgi:hypothetical protein
VCRLCAWILLKYHIPLLCVLRFCASGTRYFCSATASLVQAWLCLFLLFVCATSDMHSKIWSWWTLCVNRASSHAQPCMSCASSACPSSISLGALVHTDSIMQTMQSTLSLFECGNRRRERCKTEASRRCQCECHPVVGCVRELERNTLVRLRSSNCSLWTGSNMQSLINIVIAEMHMRTVYVPV